MDLVQNVSGLTFIIEKGNNWSLDIVKSLVGKLGRKLRGWTLFSIQQMIKPRVRTALFQLLA